MTGIADDLRFAIRNLRQAPAVTATVVATLAVAIAANTAVFSAADAVLLHPLPVSHPDRLMVLWETSPGRNQPVREVSHRNFVDWRARSRSFDNMAAISSVTWSTVLDDRGHLGRAQRAAVSGSFFDVLGVAPLVGRTLRPDDDEPGASRVAVLGHALWQQRFGGNSSIVGTTVRLEDDPVRIVGVMPSGFSYPRGAELWTAVIPELQRFNVPGKLEAVEARHFGLLYVIGRLKPDVTIAAAHAELDAIIRTVPEFEPRISSAEPVCRAHPAARPGVRTDPAGVAAAPRHGWIGAGGRVRKCVRAARREGHGPPSRHRSEDGPWRRARPCAARVARRDGNNHGLCHRGGSPDGSCWPWSPP